MRGAGEEDLGGGGVERTCVDERGLALNGMGRGKGKDWGREGRTKLLGLGGVHDEGGEGHVLVADGEGGGAGHCVVVGEVAGVR